MALLAGLSLLLVQGCSRASYSDQPLLGATQKRELEDKLDGYHRSYRVHVPRNYQPSSPWPVVIAIHGAYSTAEYHEQRTGFSRVAEQKGFIVLYPNGIGLFGWLQHWNAGHCCGKALGDNIDDIGFIFAALDDMATYLNIDRRRIYVTGFSNGGMLTHRIGAERGAQVAAIAPVAGAMGGSEHPGEALWQIPAPSRPMPVLMIHGSLDDRVPYKGGPRPDKPGSQQYLPVTAAVDYWVNENGCPPQAQQQTIDSVIITREFWNGCSQNAAVELWTIENWKHTWPGPDDLTNPPSIDLNGFDAAETIWRFFENHELPYPDSSDGSFQ